MGNLDITNADYSDMTNYVEDVTVDTKTLDSPSSVGETEYTHTDWSKWYGYFIAVPELFQAVNMKSVWTVGKGYTADDMTMTILDHITGWGKESFKDVLYNMEACKNICGDAFAEIIKDPDTKLLVNLKVLNPATVKIITNSAGRIIRYEHMPVGHTGKPRKLSPDKVFHLINCRIGDQIHGISRIEPMEPTIKALNESLVDTKKVMHYQGRPFILWKLKTDNATDIADFKLKKDKAKNLQEDLTIPDDKDIVDHEVIQLNPSNFILQWRKDLTNVFYRGLGMPLVLFGQAGQNESGGKVEFTGHDQVWENDQRYIEQQVWNQLQLKINLVNPQTILNTLKSDEQKDANQGQEFQQGDLTAGAAR